MNHLLLFLLLSLPAIAQENIRICTYNVLNFGGSQTSGERIAALENVLDPITPTILVVQEINGTSDGAAQFRDNVLLFVDSRLKLAPFADGEDTDNALFYDSTVVEVVKHVVVGSITRIIDRWTVTVLDTKDTFAIYGCHLKAGETANDKDVRAAEAQLIRTDYLTALPPHYGFLVAGNLNVYSSAEVAYQRLITGDSENVMDPTNRPGTWHNSDAHADIHTQATHDTASGGFISGGIDDRFDFILLSPALMGKYVTGSYTTFGNDALHFNKSINAEPANSVVSQEVANALYDASNHLPVYLDLNFQQTTDVEIEELVRMGLGLW